MNKAFEKILERLDEELRKSEERYYRYSEERYYRYLDDSNLPCMFDKSDIEEKRVDTIKEMLEIVQEVAEEYNGGWISVKDRLPDKAGSYLVIGKSGGATVTRWYMPSEYYPEGHFGGNSTDYIRYWMPRPEPPKESD